MWQAGVFFLTRSVNQILSRRAFVFRSAQIARIRGIGLEPGPSMNDENVTQSADYTVQ